MARFYLKDFVKANEISGIVAIKWQVAEDPNFNNIIKEETLYGDDVDVWETELTCSDGSTCTDDNEVYVRCKIYSKNVNETFESDYYYHTNKSKDPKLLDLTDPTGNIIGKALVDKVNNTYKIIW